MDELPAAVTAPSADSVIGELPASVPLLTRTRIHALRPGTFPADPAELTVTAGDIATTAAAYDASRYQAPVVIGHPLTDDPAWGWVLAANADAAGLWLDVELLPEMADLVRDGRYRTVSVALWTPEAPGNPTPGVWSLKHLGFLGARPPAVKGLQAVRLNSEADTGVVSITCADAKGEAGSGTGASVRREIRRLKSAGMSLQDISSALTKQGADASRSAGTLGAILNEEIANPPDSLLNALRAVKPSEDVDMSEHLNEREAALSARETALNRRETELRIAGYRAEVEQHVAAGRVTAAEVEPLTQIMERLTAAPTVTLAEGDTPAIELLRQHLTGLPARVTLGEHAAPAAAPGAPLPKIPGGYRLSESGLDLHTRAVAWQATHKTDYLTAVRAVQAQH